ncbi:MAG: SGNH/GDSL hydrolase family protein [Chloroflexota bacterium]
MRGATTAAALVIGLAACGPAAAPSVREGALRYVALGDSYTIGTSVNAAESWPSQLVTRVPSLQLVANLGVNGYTSRDLIDEELPALAGLRPEFMTLLIGVNDVVQGVPTSAYQANVAMILDAVLALAPNDRLVCVATPDYTVTPQGAAFGSPGQQQAGIEQVNAILRDACGQRGIRFVPDTFEISGRAATERSLVAGDGLHPSGKQYGLWVDAIQPVVEELLLPSGDP